MNRYKYLLYKRHLILKLGPLQMKTNWESFITNITLSKFWIFLIPFYCDKIVPLLMSKNSLCLIFSSVRLKILLNNMTVFNFKSFHCLHHFCRVQFGMLSKKCTYNLKTFCCLYFWIVERLITSFWYECK